MKPKTVLLGLLFSLLTMLGFSQESIAELQVDYQTLPLGIDVETPQFSWQMVTTTSERGMTQEAYRIVVVDEKGTTVWDSGKVEDDSSLGIRYKGKELRPRTKYDYTITVWDTKGNTLTDSAWFETGLLDSTPSSQRWNDAKWIGGGEEDMVLYSHYLSVFKLEYALQLDEASKSTKASFVFGGNDPRLLNKDLNIQGVENGENESFIRFELDISAVNGADNGLAKFKVYRVGYTTDDSNVKPFRSYDIPSHLIHEANKYDKHTFYVEGVFGLFQAFLDGTDEEHKISDNDDKNPSPFGKIGFNLNPVGFGNDYISFPMLGDIGFYLDAKQKARFSDVYIRNFREPSNTLFSENLNSKETYQGIFKASLEDNANFSISDETYQIGGGENEAMVLADPSRNATPMLRAEFKTGNKTVTKARLYVTARGIYEMYLNGQRIGADYFTPGLTQYNKTQMYQTYDVTSLVNSGENALGGWLGEGWWSGNITYLGENWNFFGDRQSLLAQLVITYGDGSEQVITTNDTDWKLNTDGPIRYGSFFQGEVYDARKEETISGWATVGFDDSGWKNAAIVPIEGTTFQAAGFDYEDVALLGKIGKSPTIVERLDPIGMEEVRPGVYVYDMGQNMVGFPEIQLPPGKMGDTVILRYAEVKYPDLPEYEGNMGMIMLENIRAALTQDIYIRKGGAETIRPRFTFHGYRFLEVTGVEAPVPLENIKGLVISSIDELASRYETSNELVNKLWENITWSLRGNFLSIPTDTPARNERMGWSGDINVFSKASTYLADVEPFLRRHLLAMRDMQREDGRFTDVAPVGGGFGGTLWGSAGIIIPWELYQQYGDLRVLEEHYGAMKKYVEFLTSKINPETGILNEGPLGDWLSPEGFKNEDTSFWSAYHLRDLEILAKTARMLGKADDAKEFEKQYAVRKAFFNTTYVDATTGKSLHLGNQSLRFGPPIAEDKRKKAGDFVDTQASYAIPLHLGVLTPENRKKTVERLALSIKRSNEDELGIRRPEYSLMTGFIGTASLNHALSENGRHDLAYRLLQQETYPSWLYSVKNGATTIWERLNSYTVEDGFGGNNSMNSFNHYSFGAVAGWMYEYSLGIQRDPEHPGFKQFILRPVPDPTGKMTWAKGYYDSMYGRIKSEWKSNETGWIFKTTIPPNTSATLYLDANSVENITEGEIKLKESKGIKILPMQDSQVVLELASGSYVFEIKK
ncbi:family 78 glycoside hydrolase catalytic domain [Flavobacteriaceae bacterium TP-CH-4]|uniref:alpha-L-rhamnosidase n=1 Tax=Pelagihabitans pacificus TaxID=2696054 RepID=A0A967AVD8_9FLAO|nr:family 78 glycoside hydrolase catalytic domain [Pelagihabitans pacificus]NHF59758.1 family 78 glycoside hydrolase catalytic domain [Pelagihabitans pacificus]